MANQTLIKLAVLSKFFEGSTTLIDRGENSVASGHVKNVTYIKELNLLKGVIYASMKKKTYDVEINFNNERDITVATCSCPKGILKCHHMAALLIYAKSNISVTDQKCVWSMRKTLETETVQTCSMLYPSENKFDAICDSLSVKLAISNFKEDLKRFDGAIGFAWLLSPDVCDNTSICVDIEDILFSKEYLFATNKMELLRTKCLLKEEKIKEIENITKGQSENENWLIVRKNRLTASRFGIILQACRRNKYPPSLFKSLMGSYNLDGIKAIQWGRNNEKHALQEFTSQTGIVVEKSGIWLDTSGFLGASPDGLIDTDTIIEIKCPYKYRNSNVVELLTKEKSYFISLTNGSSVINKDHPYYHQVQGQLYLTGRSKCIFLIWTTKDMAMFTVEKEQNWENNLNILKKFYENNYIKHLVK